MPDEKTLILPFDSKTATEARYRVQVTPRARPVTRPKQQPPHAVVLFNDSLNRFEWVTSVLRKVLRCTPRRAMWMTLKTHVTGRGIVWTGSLEVAELKAEQIRDCGPDPDRSSSKPLRVHVEPLPN